MRTTVDLPDDLLRRAKIHAAARGMALKDVLAAGLEKELAPILLEVRKGRKGPIPVRIAGTNWSFPYLTNAELAEAMERGEG